MHSRDVAPSAKLPADGNRLRRSVRSRSSRGDGMRADLGGHRAFLGDDRGGLQEALEGRLRDNLAHGRGERPAGQAERSC